MQQICHGENVNKCEYYFIAHKLTKRWKGAFMGAGWGWEMRGEERREGKGTVV